MARQLIVVLDFFIIDACLITHRHTTIGRTPLYEWSARHRDPYLKTHNTHKRQNPMPPEGFETVIPASERPQTHVLDGATTGIGYWNGLLLRICLASLTIKGWKVPNAGFYKTICTSPVTV